MFTFISETSNTSSFVLVFLFSCVSYYDPPSVKNSNSHVLSHFLSGLLYFAQLRLSPYWLHSDTSGWCVMMELTWIVLYERVTVPRIKYPWLFRQQHKKDDTVLYLFRSLKLHHLEQAGDLWNVYLFRTLQ